MRLDEGAETAFYNFMESSLYFMGEGELDASF